MKQHNWVLLTHFLTNLWKCPTRSYNFNFCLFLFCAENEPGKHKRTFSYFSGLGSYN